MNSQEQGSIKTKTLLTLLSMLTLDIIQSSQASTSTPQDEEQQKLLSNLTKINLRTILLTT